MAIPARSADRNNTVQEITMQARRVLFLVFFLACLVLAMTSIASASSFTYVVAYGDSLSDNGNLFAATGDTYPPPPYFDGRMSNGRVTVEYLATSLQSPLLDFAWIGATTGVGNDADGGTQTSFGKFGFPGMLPQVAGSLSTVAPFASSSLFVVWGGPNDFLTNGFSAATANAAVADLDSIISGLQGIGAQHILVPGMPDLGLTPDYYGNMNATALSVYFNQELVASLPPGVTYFDTFGFMHTVTADPGAYGFTNVNTPCFNGTSVCSTPSTYLFWDGFHPTTAADQILAGQFADALPEPSTILMLGTGIVLAGVLGRKLIR
jgi:cholinesterase